MRYRALRIVSTVYRVMGWMVIVVGLLSSCGLAALAIATPGWLGGAMGYGPGAGMVEGVVVALITLVGGLIMTALYGITFLALAEGIQVFLDIEENTREIARRIKELPRASAGAPE